MIQEKSREILTSSTFSINKQIKKSVYLLQLELATSFGVVALGNGKKKFLRADGSP